MSGAATSDPEVLQRVVLVTGPSGAGRGTAIAALEDFGYETIDNLPLSMVPRLLSGEVRGRPVALGIDVRNRDFSVGAMIELTDGLTRDPTIHLELLYLDASIDVLERRYSETRRRHPLAPIEAPREGIVTEIEMLLPIRARAEVLIDTTLTSPHDLREEISRFFDPGLLDRLTVSVHSFSYKRGVPRGVDIMFDCRFLTNPHWLPELRPFTGLDPRVAAHVESDQRHAEFLDRILGLLLFQLPAHVEEGRTHVAIGFGCTGGTHRSVAMAEKVAKALAESGWQVSKRHRELERHAITVPDQNTRIGA